MPALIDLTGQTFGRWTVLGLARPKPGRTMWRVQCECGAKGEVSGVALTHGRSGECLRCSRDRAMPDRAHATRGGNLVSAVEAGRLIGLSSRMMRQYAAAGRIEGTKIGGVWMFDPRKLPAASDSPQTGAKIVVDTPRRGRPAPPLSEIDPAAPLVSRILRAALAALGYDSAEAVARAAGISPRTALNLLTGVTADPGVRTLAPLLRVICPRDADGGWGWFGRQLREAT